MAGAESNRRFRDFSTSPTHRDAIWDVPFVRRRRRAIAFRNRARGCRRRCGQGWRRVFSCRFCFRRRGFLVLLQTKGHIYGKNAMDRFRDGKQARSREFTDSHDANFSFFLHSPQQQHLTPFGTLWPPSFHVLHVFRGSKTHFKIPNRPPASRFRRVPTGNSHRHLFQHQFKFISLFRVLIKRRRGAKHFGRNMFGRNGVVD